MTSARKIAANRENARRSTGPRTNAGKRRARQNALRHGLAVRLVSRPHITEEVKRLAQAISGENSDAAQLDQAQTVAETELDLRRIRRARAAIMERLSAALSEPALLDSSESVLVDAASDLLKIDRYERRAVSRRKFAIRLLAGLRQHIA